MAHETDDRRGRLVSFVSLAVAAHILLHQYPCRTAHPSAIPYYFPVDRPTQPRKYRNTAALQGSTPFA